MCDPVTATVVAGTAFSAVQGIQAGRAQRAHQRRQAQANLNAVVDTRANEKQATLLDSVANKQEARVVALEASIASAEAKSAARVEYADDRSSGRLNRILTDYNVHEGRYREKIDVELERAENNEEYRDKVSRANFEARKAGAHNLANAPVQNVDFGAILSGIGGAFAAR